MPVDPDLAAVLLAILLAAVLGAVGSARGRRAAATCESCGRKLIQNLPTCDCNPFA